MRPKDVPYAKVKCDPITGKRDLKMGNKWSGVGWGAKGTLKALWSFKVERSQIKISTTLLNNPIALFSNAVVKMRKEKCRKNPAAVFIFNPK